MLGEGIVLRKKCWVVEAFVTVELLNLWTVDAVIVDSHNRFARSLIAISLEQRDL